MSEGAPWVVDVTEADFQEVVLAESHRRPVVVDFWAPWCGPCRALGPVLEKLVAERQGAVLLARVNTEEAPRLAQYFRIEAIPAVKAFRNSTLVYEFEGVLPEAQLRSFLDAISAGEAGGPLAEAESLEAGQPAEAEALYREALAQDAENTPARLGLARVLLAQGQTGEVEEVLAPVGSEGEVGAEAERLLAVLYFQTVSRDFADEATLRRHVGADPKAATPRYELGCVLARRGAYPEALEMLLSAAERDAGLAAGAARKAMVKVFYALGADHPLANDYRTRLARLLY
jgi:putative thioredoxin